MGPYNFCDRQTDTQTDRHGDSKTNPAQRAESGKITKKIVNQGNGTFSDRIMAKRENSKAYQNISLHIAA